MPSTDGGSLPRASDSRDSIGSVELGAAAVSLPPSSPSIPEGAAASDGLNGQPASKRLTRAMSSDSMLASSSSVQTGSIMRTVTNVEVLPQEQVASMRAVFEMFDLSGDGVIQAAEVGSILHRLNLVTSRRMIRTIIEIVDIDGDGELQFDEFVTLMARVKEEVDQGERALLPR